MAGDWIPIRATLPTAREVLILAEQCRCEVDVILGRLVRLWIWLDAETSDGRLFGVTVEMASKSLHLPKSFFEALVSVGWLEVHEWGLSIPGWDRWFSQSAKARLGESLRKRMMRMSGQMSGKCPDKRPENVRTTEEKRRVNHKTPPLNSPPAARGGNLDWGKVVFPPGVEDSPSLREAIERWLTYRRKIRKPYRDPEQQISLLLKRLGTRIGEAIEHSMAMGYQGCFLPPGQPAQGADFESLFEIPDGELAGEEG
jgi:hypothetical protein